MKKSSEALSKMQERSGIHRRKLTTGKVRVDEVESTPPKQKDEETDKAHK